MGVLYRYTIRLTLIITVSLSCVVTTTFSHASKPTENLQSQGNVIEGLKKLNRRISEEIGWENSKELGLVLEGTLTPIKTLGMEINVPEGWHIITKEDAESALNIERDLTPRQSMKVQAWIENIGNSVFAISKHPEPYDGINPSFILSWIELPKNGIDMGFEDQKNSVTRILNELIVPRTQQITENFELLKETEISSVLVKSGECHAQAQTKVQYTVTLKDGNQKYGVSEIYVICAREHLLIAELASSKEGAEEEKRALTKMLKSLKYLK